MALPASDRLTLRMSDMAATIPADTLEATGELWQVVSEQHGKDDAVARIIAAVTTLARSSSPAQLNRVLGASSDYAVLMRLMEQPETLAAVSARDPLAPARLRGLAVRERLLAAEGGVLTAEQAGAALGITRQAIDNRRKRGGVLAVQLGRRGYRYPAWQFTPDGVLPGLKETLAVMADQTPWVQFAFLLNANAWLGDRRPLDVLRVGEVAAVVDAAGQYGEQSAA